MDHSQSAVASLFHVTSKEIRYIGDYLTYNTRVRIIPLLLHVGVHLAAVNKSTLCLPCQIARLHPQA